MSRIPTIYDDIKRNVGKRVVVITNDNHTRVGLFEEDKGDSIILRLDGHVKNATIIRYLDIDSIAPELE